jgi:hypothetical protein
VNWVGHQMGAVNIYSSNCMIGGESWKPTDMCQWSRPPVHAQRDAYDVRRDAQRTATAR